MTHNAEIDVPTRSLSLADGRRLAYSLYGDPRGRPVHFFHGFPSSRLLAAIVHERAVAAKVCLVAADRPGFGESSPRPQRTLMDWPDDVCELADSLAHEHIDVVGVSCGGAYALACAAKIPQRVRGVALLAGMGPMDRPEIRRTQLPALKVMFALARLNPRLASPVFWLDRIVFGKDPASAVAAVKRMLSGPDRALLTTHPVVADRFVASMREAYRQGIGAAMQEARLIALPRPYTLSRLDVPVHIFQGGLDRHVPEMMGRHLADEIPTARWHHFPGEGHLSILWNRFDECLNALEI